MAQIALEPNEVNQIATAILAVLKPRLEQILKTSIQPAVNTPPRHDLSALSGPVEDWRPADRKWGYVFGSFELWSCAAVQHYLGDIDRKTVERLRQDGKIRGGRTSPTGGRRLYCSHSVALYAASLED